MIPSKEMLQIIPGTNYFNRGILLTDQGTNYSTGVMLQITLGTNYSNRGMLITPQDTNFSSFSIGGVLKTTKYNSYSTGRIL